MKQDVDSFRIENQGQLQSVMESGCSHILKSGYFRADTR